MLRRLQARPSPAPARRSLNGSQSLNCSLVEIIPLIGANGKPVIENANSHLAPLLHRHPRRRRMTSRSFNASANAGLAEFVDLGGQLAFMPVFYSIASLSMRPKLAWLPRLSSSMQILPRLAVTEFSLSQ